MTRFSKPRERTFPPKRPPPPISLSDSELDRVMQIAKMLEPEKRSVLLQRIAAAVRRGDSGGIDAITQRSLRGLIHGSVA
jgi:hypothetical protein